MHSSLQLCDKLVIDSVRMRSERHSHSCFSSNALAELYEVLVQRRLATSESDTQTSVRIEIMEPADQSFNV
jgi:hypothetical protein